MYSLGVCIFTAFCVLMIAAVPLWNGFIHSAKAIEQHPMYLLIDNGQPVCQDCEQNQSLSQLSHTPAGIQPFTTVDSTPQETESLLTKIQWLPEWVIVTIRLLVGAVGLLILTVHWRLYRNLADIQ